MFVAAVGCVGDHVKLCVSPSENKMSKKTGNLTSLVTEYRCFDTFDYFYEINNFEDTTQLFVVADDFMVLEIKV